VASFAPTALLPALDFELLPRAEDAQELVAAWKVMRRWKRKRAGESGLRKWRRETVLSEIALYRKVTRQPPFHRANSDRVLTFSVCTNQMREVHLHNALFKRFSNNA
jgi:hypothetical protein